jgi:hypothetical protein
MRTSLNFQCLIPYPVFRKTTNVLILLFLSVLILSFSACGGDSGDGDDPNTEDSFDYTRGNANIGKPGPGGGIVFYYKSAGFEVKLKNGSSYTAYYLEAAPSDQSTAQWGAACAMWICETISGVTSSTSLVDVNIIGDGRKNTQSMVNSQNCVAAHLCVNLTTGGKDDWFLPSLGELNELYKLYVFNGEGAYANLTANTYWSSSQHSDSGFDSYAWYQNFANGGQSYSSKSNQYSVRAIRAF